MSDKIFEPIDIESGKLLREVRVFEVKRDLPLHEKPDGTKEFLFIKGEIFEETFDEPNYITSTNSGRDCKYYIGLPWVSANLFEYKGTIPAEKSKYFDAIGLEKLVKARKRTQTTIAKANDKIAEIEYFLNRM